MHICITSANILFIATYAAQKTLSLEFLGLLRKMHRVPKFSPEWTLSRIEMRYIVEELEYLYKTSVKKKAWGFRR